MPAYNAATTIESAVRSVMGQTYPHWRLLVIDDGSADDTCAIVTRLVEEDRRITLVRNEQNMGVAKTRNKGLDLCTDGCVAFLDSDDLWHPDKLTRQMKKMCEEHADLVYSSYGIIDCDGKPCRNAYRVPETADFNRMLKENVVGCSAALISQTIARDYRFNPEFYHEDYCLWLKILQDGHKAVGCQEVLMNWRLASGSRSFDKRNGARNRWRIYRRQLGLSLPKSTIAFVSYAVNGLRKYRHRSKAGVPHEWE